MGLLHQGLFDRLALPFTPNAAVEAFAVMEANGTTTVNGQIILQTKQPTTSGGKTLYVNGPSDVANGGYGRCLLAVDEPAWALYDTGDGTPSAGDGWGPKASSFKLTPSDDGYVCIGDADTSNGRVLVVRREAAVRNAELSATFMPGDGSVAAIFSDHNEEEAFTAYINNPAHEFGIGRAGAGAHAGTLCWVVWNKKNERWEIVAGQFKKIASGISDDQIAVNTYGTISIYWENYPTDTTMVDSGENVEALNWANPQVEINDKVAVSYDSHEGLWTIITP